MQPSLFWYVPFACHSLEFIRPLLILWITFFFRGYSPIWAATSPSLDILISLIVCTGALLWSNMSKFNDTEGYLNFKSTFVPGGYFFCQVSFLCFQPGAAFLAICCILELKSVFCMHFGARISHLRAHLAFGFWLLALGFGFWFWFHLALVLAVHFTWLLAFVGF